MGILFTLAIIFVVGIIYGLAEKIKNTKASSIEKYNTQINTSAVEHSLIRAQKEFNQGNFQGAIAYLNVGISIEPNNYNLLNKRGNAKVQLNQIKEALIDFRRSLELESDYVKNAEGYKYFQNAINLQQVDKFNEFNSIEDFY